MALKKKVARKAPRKMKAYASFAEWKRDQTSKNQKLIGALSRIISSSAPDFKTSVKWGQGCWTLGNVPKVYIHAEPDHLHFGFYAGSKLHDPDGLLVGKGQYVRHVKIFKAADISRDALVAFIQQVM